MLLITEMLLPFHIVIEFIEWFMIRQNFHDKKPEHDCMEMVIACLVCKSQNIILLH